MNNIKNRNVTVKSNVTLKNRGAVPPIDNMPNAYFDVRLKDALTPEQKMLREKMMFWAQTIYDENKNPIEDVCYKGCINCGKANNNCKKTQNIKLL